MRRCVRRKASAAAGRGHLGRWVRAGLAALVIVGMFALLPVLTAQRIRETFSQITQLNLFGLVVVGWLLAELMPTLVRPLTDVWTRWVP